jgi:hypothetical protein
LLPYKSVQSRLQVPWRISCTRPKRRHEDGCNMKTVCVCVCVCASQLEAPSETACVSADQPSIHSSHSDCDGIYICSKAIAKQFQKQNESKKHNKGIQDRKAILQTSACFRVWSPYLRCTSGARVSILRGFGNLHTA